LGTMFGHYVWALYLGTIFWGTIFWAGGYSRSIS
jgi:hypothetical protein